MAPITHSCLPYLIASNNPIQTNELTEIVYNALPEQNLRGRFQEILRVLIRLFLFLAVVPLVEIWLLMKLAEYTSSVTTIAIVLLTGVFGISLVRWHKLHARRKIQMQLASGQSPTQTIVSGVLIQVAGGLLLAPGLLTDAAGLLLLIPTVRFAVAAYLQKRFVTSFTTRFRSSVWMQPSSFESEFDNDGVANSSERPSVRVVEPDLPRIDQ